LRIHHVAQATPVIEAIDRLDEAEHALLDQILAEQRRRAIAAGEEQDHGQVGLHEAMAGLGDRARRGRDRRRRDSRRRLIGDQVIDVERVQPRGGVAGVEREHRDGLGQPIRDEARDLASRCRFR
jgi:hypothetical protein